MTSVLVAKDAVAPDARRVARGKGGASSPPFKPDDTLGFLWGAYVDAQGVAQQTKHINDGIRAGMAWRHWLDAFLQDGERTHG